MSSRCGAAARTAVLIAELRGRQPGRALDVGCGEGADAIWLARHGWDVTGVDVSSVALERAAATARAAGVSVQWIYADIAGMQPRPRGFDLVTVHYPALRRADGEPAIHARCSTRPLPAGRSWSSVTPRWTPNGLARTA